MIDGFIREIPNQLQNITWKSTSKIAEIPTLLKDNLLTQKTFIPETCRSLKKQAHRTDPLQMLDPANLHANKTNIIL